MTMTRQFAFGALPPDEFKWQIGKTAGAIRFVKDAKEILAEGRLSPETAGRLQAWVTRVMEGELLDADHFLSSQEIVARCV